MKRTVAWLTALLAIGAVGQASSAVELGPLPAGAVSESHMGPADEFIVYIVFDPAPFQAMVPEGMAFLRLDQLSRYNPDVAAYVQAHPERAGWAWSFFEIIGLKDMDYDGVRARLGPDGGMAVWYGSLRRIDRSDERPKGYNDFALGTWLSDAALAAQMRSRGYPVDPARISFRRTDREAHGRLRVKGLAIEASCRLGAVPHTPEWGEAPYSYETVWTPRTVASTFEVLSWGGHQTRDCVDPVWRVSGSHPLARAFRQRPIAGPRVSGVEFATGYMVHGSLYRRP